MIKVLFQLFWRIVLVFSVPMLSMMRRAAAGQYIDSAAVYADELIVFGCVICLLIGAFLGVKYPAPESETPLSPSVKAAASVLGGISAFIYVLHVDKQLTLLNPLWVGGVAFVAPAIIQIIRPLAVGFAERFIKSKAGTGTE